jgi:hypothetical protein
MLDLSKMTDKQRRASYALIRRGSLRHLLHTKQQMLYDLVHTNPEAMIYSSRKVGKSYAMVVLGIEHCLRHPNNIVKHVFPTLTLAKEVVSELMGKIIPFLPEDLQPRAYRGARPYWQFPNGSVFLINGADPSAVTGLRGPRCDMFLLDEVCFFDKGSFTDTLFGAIIPQQTTVPIKIIYASTPPEDTSHPSLDIVLTKMLKNNTLIKFTIYDSPIMTPEKIRELEKMYADKPNQWRREYLAELVANDDRRVCPEFSRADHVSDYLPLDRDPQVYEQELKYAGMIVADYGIVDQAGILGGWYDHLENRLVIDFEHAEKAMGLRRFKEVLDGMEEDLQNWCEPVDYCIDVFEQAGFELRNEYMMIFRKPTKSKLEDQVGVLRNAMANDRIVINPRCTKLILQLEQGLWKETEKVKDFERTEEFGHLDLVAALTYMVKFCPWGRRPGQHNFSKLTVGRRKK